MREVNQCAPHDGVQNGIRLFAEVSPRLQEAGIMVSSTSHLQLCRQFHQQQKRIGQTVSDQLVFPASTGQISAIGPTPSDQFSSLTANRERIHRFLSEFIA